MNPGHEPQRLSGQSAGRLVSLAEGTGGERVQGQRILSNGDVIQVGTASFRFDFRTPYSQPDSILHIYERRRRVG